MNRKQQASNFMFAGGIAEIIIAIAHFLMPFQFYKTGEITKLSDDYQSFILLATLAIGLCVGVFGMLTIYFSKKILRGDTAAWVFGISQGVLWLGRTILELLLPVKIPLFFLSNPTTIVLPLSVLLTLLFLIPLIFYKENLLMKSNGT